MAKLISVNAALPRDVAWRGETVHTAIWKQPVQGRRMVRRLNVDGDAQGDLAGHGGEHRAVMVYQQDSYRYWEKHLGRTDFTLGQFGENFTVDGLADDEVCVGDRYQIGTTLLEVTQPRVTCYRLGIRMNQPDMAALVVAHHRPGFYFRVLREGEVGAGDEIVKVLEGPGHMTVAEIDSLLYLPGHTAEKLQKALGIPALSAGWKGSFQALANQSLKSADIAPGWAGFRQMQVSRVDRETASVVSLSLIDPGEGLLPSALPGQFVVVKLPVKPDAPAILRNYSISNAPGSNAYRVSVKKEANGAASSYVHEHVKAGDKLELSAPRGNFLLRPGNDPIVFISAGIGATPVLAMLHAVALGGGSRQVWWLYSARNRASHPFVRECGELLTSIPGASSHVVYSRPEAGDRLGTDYDSSGHLDGASLDRLEIPKVADFYMCGPSSFLRNMSAAIVQRGTEASKIHTEIFGPDPSLTPGIAAVPEHRAHPPAGESGAGPLVSFTRSGLTIPWDTRFGSLLEFAEACEVPVRWSCRTGVCHTCECALVGGAVDYDPDPLQMPAAGNLLICCSRPRGTVEIDL